jgi:uncharacterized cupin superfamily protein
MTEWFVRNARDARWKENELGATCEFEEDGVQFDELGVNLTSLRPGQPNCPRNVAHAIVGAGDGPSLVLAVGSRVGPDEILYPVDDVALAHGAGVETETPLPKEAYARFTRPAPEVPFREEFLA